MIVYPLPMTNTDFHTDEEGRIKFQRHLGNIKLICELVTRDMADPELLKEMLAELDY